MANKKELPTEKIQGLLKEVVDHFSREDSTVRERQILTYRKLKLMWDNLSNIWYSQTAHDWRVWDANANGEDGFQAYYDKPVNVFRAYLESIIAALSVTVPPVTCYPKDADNNLDLLTAKSGDKIAELIYRQNSLNLEWLHALFIWCTEGTVAAYNYPKSDKKYGTYEKDVFEDYSEEYQNLVCPNCQFIFEEKVTPESVIDNQSLELCPQCGLEIIPELKNEIEEGRRKIRIDILPKTRVCTEVYGGLFVKVANYAKKQEDSPYLIFSYETHYANAIEKFEHLHGNKKLSEKIKNSAGGPQDPYEEWARVSTQYRGEYPDNTVTIRNAWLRPCSFNVLKAEDTEILKDFYPNGVKVVLVNDEFGEAVAEDLDEHWTLSYNPLADYITHDPLGLLLTSIQEITNDIISLTLQTMEHGIPQTFADPGVLDFDGYRQSPATPGGIYEATPKAGQRIGDAFHEVKTATLSGEVLPFANNIQSLGQQVSGALPSLFGGAIEGSGTASEYSMSRAQALQRLQNTWKVLCDWWKNMHSKAIPMFIENMKDDERDVKKGKDGNYINVLIRKSDLEGEIGKVEIEANENLPMTWGQRKDVIMALLTSGQPELMKTIMSPQNLPFIRQAIGLDDLYIPDEDDRNKQYEEIQLLLQGEAIEELDQMTGEEIEFPSIEPEEIDNHLIHYEICRGWAVSDIGRETKITNEAGYRNVLVHAKMHMVMIQSAMSGGPATTDEQGAVPAEKPNKLSGKEAPITGEANVSEIV